MAVISFRRTLTWQTESDGIPCRPVLLRDWDHVVCCALDWVSLAPDPAQYQWALQNEKM